MKRYREWTDRELYAASVRDERAFEELVTRYERFVYNVAYGVLGSGDDAADAAQDAFLKLWRSAPGWRGECEVKTWIYRISRSTALDVARARAQRTAAPIEEAASVADTSPTPEEQIETRDKIRVVREAIDSLGDAYREIIELREICGMSYREIAEAAGIDIGTVKSRLSRARAELYTILKEKLGEDGTNEP